MVITRRSSRTARLSFLALGAFFAPRTPADGGLDDPATVRAMVDAYKKDPLGPYQTLRWFCPDGSILLPQQRCPTPGGIQHAVPKDGVRNLALRQHVFLGQILAGTPNDEFLDEANGFSRPMQYQLERYLRAVDDGWIMRKAYAFRGAVQAEDEEAWSRRFLEWLVARDDLLASRFFLDRKSTRLNSSHTLISYAVFCFKKKNTKRITDILL